MEIFIGVNSNETGEKKARSFWLRAFGCKRIAGYGRMCGGSTVSLTEHKTEGMFPTSVGM